MLIFGRITPLGLARGKLIIKKGKSLGTGKCHFGGTFFDHTRVLGISTLGSVHSQASAYSLCSGVTMGVCQGPTINRQRSIGDLTGTYVSMSSVIGLPPRRTWAH